jgi:hypothetical protein
MPASDPHTEPVEWRRLSPRLWVGRRDGAPIGMIERGRRYTATDASEQVRGTFKTLALAQAALAGPARPPRVAPASRLEPDGRLMVVGAGLLGLLAASTATVGLAGVG